MKAKFFPRERELKVFDEAGEELYALQSITELRFGAGAYYFEEMPAEEFQEDAPAAQTLENEFYSLAAAPENPQNTFVINQLLKKFKAMEPVAVRTGQDLVDDRPQARRLWLRDLKALEKSIAKEVRKLIEANGGESCQWRGFTGKKI